MEKIQGIPNYANGKKPGLSFNIFALWQVFIKQGIVIWLVTLPIQFLLFTSTTSSLNIFNIIGLIIISVGFFGNVLQTSN